MPQRRRRLLRAVVFARDPGGLPERGVAARPLAGTLDESKVPRIVHSAAMTCHERPRPSSSRPLSVIMDVHRERCAARLPRSHQERTAMELCGPTWPPCLLPAAGMDRQPDDRQTAPTSEGDRMPVAFTVRAALTDRAPEPDLRPPSLGITPRARTWTAYCRHPANPGGSLSPHPWSSATRLESARTM